MTTSEESGADIARLADDVENVACRQLPPLPLLNTIRVMNRIVEDLEPDRHMVVAMVIEQRDDQVWLLHVIDDDL